MYDDGMDASAPAAPPEEQPDEGEGQTGLLAKSFFMGKEPKPGDICSVKIEKIFDDQVEVSYIPHHEEESDLGETEPPPAGDEADMMG